MLQPDKNGSHPSPAVTPLGDVNKSPPPSLLGDRSPRGSSIAVNSRGPPTLTLSGTHFLKAPMAKPSGKRITTLRVPFPKFACWASVFGTKTIPTAEGGG